MNLKRTLPAALAVSMTLTGCVWASDGKTDEETRIVLSDTTVTVNGTTASTDPTADVYTGGEIIFYEQGTDSSYGAGGEADMHSAAEAEAHTLVTITQPGTYRLSGSLSAGQIFVDLGKGAKSDPEAVVTLILDDVDITCTVGPAVFFYRVYECDEAWTAYDDGETEDYTASASVDTTAAGANVILAAGSENYVTGSHVAKIYKTGTTKKLHKYDGAFYSRMSMNIDGDNGDDTGLLAITADNEGLDSELHLTLNGGTVTIDSQDDGINTNEDGVSVTTVNGGSLTINAGQGAEGDGIDSNGFLVINGGTIWTMANAATPDGGIDADQPIYLNGGTLSAFGTRNDAVSTDSEQVYMELSFASTLPKGSEVTVTDEAGETIWSAMTEKTCQAITLTTPQLELDSTYQVYVDGVLQCYNGTGSQFGPGMMGPGMGGHQGGQRPEDNGQFNGQQPPEKPENKLNGAEGQHPTPPDGLENDRFGGSFDGQFDPQRGDRDPGQFGGQGFEGQFDDKFNGQFGGGRPGMGGQQSQADGSGSTDFTLTAENMSFSGVCDSDASGKTRVSFTVDGVSRTGRSTTITSITGITPSVDLDPALIQISVNDDPSEDYAASCTLADGLEKINALLPEGEGKYLLTVAVKSGTEGYTGATQVSFTVGALPFLDVDEHDSSYEAIKALYKAGAMMGTGENRFSPKLTVTRAQAVTVLGRLLNATEATTDAFTDVEKDSWYAGYVSWAVEQGLVEGDGQGHFYPNTTVTGEQLTLMLQRLGKQSTTTHTGDLTRAQLAEMLYGVE